MDNSNGFGSFPLSTTMLLALEEGYDRAENKLTEAKKEEIRNQCRDAKSNKEIEGILRREGIDGDWDRLW